MSLKRYAAKRDASEAAICQALTQVGALWIQLDVFDLLVLFRGLWLLEVKTDRKAGGRDRMTLSQARLRAAGWPIHEVRTPDDALRAIGAVPPIERLPARQPDTITRGR